MENEFEYLSGRGGHGGHLAEKFLKNNVPIRSYRGYRVVICLSLLRSNKLNYLKTRFLTFKCL